MYHVYASHHVVGVEYAQVAQWGRQGREAYVMGKSETSPRVESMRRPARASRLDRNTHTDTDNDTDSDDGRDR